MYTVMYGVKSGGKPRTRKRAAEIFHEQHRYVSVCMRESDPLFQFYNTQGKLFPRIFFSAPPFKGDEGQNESQSSFFVG